MDGFFMRLGIIKYTQINSKRFSADLEDRKNPPFFDDFRPEKLFPQYKVASFLFQHFVPPTGRWSCEFYCFCCDTVKIRSVLEQAWKHKTANFSTILARNANFFRKEFDFFTFAALSHFNWTAGL